MQYLLVEYQSIPVLISYQTVPNEKGQGVGEGLHWKSYSLEMLTQKGKWKWGSSQLCISIGEEEKGERQAEAEVGREMISLTNKGKWTKTKLLVDKQSKIVLRPFHKNRVPH